MIMNVVVLDIRANIPYGVYSVKYYPLPVFSQHY